MSVCEGAFKSMYEDSMCENECVCVVCPLVLIGDKQEKWLSSIHWCSA